MSFSSWSKKFLLKLSFSTVDLINKFLNKIWIVKWISIAVYMFVQYVRVGPIYDNYKTNQDWDISFA